MDIDFNKIKAGIGLPAIAGVVLLVIEFIFLIALGVLSEMYVPFEHRQWISFLTIALLLCFFLPFFVWTGYRSAKKYRADVIESGITTAIVAAIIVIVKFFLNLIFTIVIMVAGIGVLSSALSQTNLAGGVALGAGLTAMMIALQLAMCFLELFVSMGINFVAGGIGGYFGGKK